MTEIDKEKLRRAFEDAYNLLHPEKKVKLKWVEQSENKKENRNEQSVHESEPE